MNKTDLINAVQEAIGPKATKLEAKKVVEAIISSLKNELAQGHQVTILKFGSFYVGQRPARVGRNPRTGATIKISKARNIKFRAGSDLKNAVSGGTDSTGPKKVA